MAYNPELVKQILGEAVASMMDGTIEIEPSKGDEDMVILKLAIS